MLNKNTKIFFLDLDGTLLDTKLNGEHWISDTNVKAIKKVQSEGKHVVISTGRCGKGVQKFMKRAGVKYAVLGNGAQVVDNKGNIYKDDRLTLKQSLMIFDFVKKHKITLKLDGSIECFGARGFYKKKLAQKFGFFPNAHYNLPMHEQYSKIVMWGKSKRKLWKLRNKLVNEIPQLSVVSSSRGWTLEVTNKRATKGLGNKFVAKEFYDITRRNEMVHLGDTLNDSTTAKYMNLIAMGNSTKKLKAFTEHVGPNYKNGGVAKIILGEK